VTPNKFDRGLVLDQSSEIPIGSHITSQELTNKLADIGGEMCLQTLTNLPSKLQNGKLQNDYEASYAFKITPDDTYIDWNRMTATEVWNKFRAFGLQKKFRLRCTYHNGTSRNMIKLAEIDIPDEKDLTLPTILAPGEVHFHKNSRKLFIGCKTGCIACSNLCISDRKLQSAFDFYNGFMQTRLKRGEKILFENIT